MSDFQFAEPHWVHLLWGVLAFGGLLVWLEYRAGHALDRLVSSVLQARLVTRASASQRLSRTVLLVLSLACGVFALMRPQWGVHYVATPQTSAELMICLDVSRSMLAEDVAPSRLERAKAEIRDLLSLLDGDHVGLIAFAGRASVLAPLTPDFGFLRLVLDNVGPHSVTRGGTRLEEPIRKAIEGFAASGDISRNILLITDGEDLDSFPLDAAKAAAERGVAIIAIGIGSETGSEIPVTDPYTGARTLVRGPDGRPAISRLDGDTLREIALVSNGAYVPAGTGVLDLEAIYERHIRRMMRGRVDERGRAVGQEGFQWAVLASIGFLFASVVVGRSVTQPVALLLVLGLSLPAPTVGAQDPNGAEAIEELEIRASDAAPSDSADLLPAREVYNRALASLARVDLDGAETQLEEARQRAGTDGELRFRSSYTLGYVSAARADALLQAEPEQALENLQRGADWYLDAIRLRPEDADARRSLEVLLRRALVLEDSLRDPESDALAERLDELIGTQRELLGALRGLLERTRDDPDAVAGEGMRREFRGYSTQQRQKLSEADQLAETVEAERAALASKAQDQKTPEEGIRMAQLEQLSYYLHRARERMGQTRRELRQRRSERAYRRGSVALTELKRARDQLQDPLVVLTALVREAAETAAYTQLMAAAEEGEAGDPEALRRPAWLTQEFLSETQQGVTLRTEELAGRISAGASAIARREAEEEPDPERARFLERLSAAEPLIQTGTRSFSAAREALELAAWEDAGKAQGTGVSALMLARELFLDLRGLVDVAWTDQRGIGRVFAPETGFEGEALAKFFPALRTRQGRNLGRGERIGTLIAEQREGLPPEGSLDDPAQVEQLESARLGLELADGVLVVANAAMGRLAAGIPDPNGPPQWADLPLLRREQKGALEALEALRRIFFSVVEHLRETAQRQRQLNDETEELAALAADPNAPPRVDPLIPRQTGLSERAVEIAEALETQSRQASATPADPNQPALNANPEEGEKLRRAAELVLASTDFMGVAAKALQAAPPEFEATRGGQDDALARLLEALALLSPPPQEQEGEQQQQQEQQQQSAGSQAPSEPEKGEQQDPGQLLQSVQDKEAARREERSRRASGYEKVERDW